MKCKTWGFQGFIKLTSAPAVFITDLNPERRNETPKLWFMQPFQWYYRSNSSELVLYMPDFIQMIRSQCIISVFVDPNPHGEKLKRYLPPPQKQLADSPLKINGFWITVFFDIVPLIVGIHWFIFGGVFWNLVSQERPNIRRSPPGWGEPRETWSAAGLRGFKATKNTWFFPQNGTKWFTGRSWYIYILWWCIVCVSLSMHIYLRIHYRCLLFILFIAVDWSHLMLPDGVEFKKR